MTLIVTLVHRTGIVQAADSHVTYESGAVRSKAKVFRVPYLRAALSLAGSYAVGATPMDEWMPQRIREYERGGERVLGSFAEWLARELEVGMSRQEQELGCLIHLAGLVGEKAARHPEFHFIRNIAGMNLKTGAYEGIGTRFQVSEDLWSRDFGSDDDHLDLRLGVSYQLYINGWPAGRIAYWQLSQRLQGFFSEQWRRADSGLRQPRTLPEWAEYVRTHLAVICGTFRMSGRTEIGGAVRVRTIPWLSSATRDG